MKTVAIIGKPYQAFIKYVAEHQPEIKLIAIHDTKDSYSYPDTVIETIAFDFSSQTSVEAGLTQKPDLYIDGVVSSYENSNLPMVWIGTYFGCSVPSEESILAATDKSIMRKKFMEYDSSITPHFTEVTSWAEVEAFVADHHFPLVLKPANLAKSILVSINHSLAELQHNFEHAQQSIGQLYQQYGVHHRQPKIIVEEFLNGSSHSIDIITDHEGKTTTTPVADYVTARQLGIEDTFVYARHLPSALTATDQQAITTCAIQGVKALGLTSTAAHTEVILTNQGPKIVEIGARFGGYRPRMYEFHAGLHIHQAMVDLALGKSLSTHATKNDLVSLYELFPSHTGRLKQITNFDQVPSLPSYVSSNQPKHPGDMVGLSKDGYKFCANIMIHSADREQFERDRSFIENQVTVELEA